MIEFREPLDLVRDVQFAQPEFVGYAYWALPVVLLAWLISIALRRNATRSYSAMIPPRWLREMPFLAGWLLVVLSLFLIAAQPYKESGGEASVKQETVIVIAAFDVSLSFAAEDYRSAMPDKNGVSAARVKGAYGSRLDASKLALAKVLPELAGNRVGIIGYCLKAKSDVPPNTDHNLNRKVLGGMTIGSAPGDGSNYADAMLLAAMQFKIADEENLRKTGKPLKKVFLLFSDGGLDAEDSEIARARKALLNQKVQAFIIGVGTGGKIPIPLYKDGMKVGNLDQGATLAEFDARPLQKDASLLRGTYLRLLPGGELKLPWESLVGTANITKTGATRLNLHWYIAVAALTLVVALQLAARLTMSKKASPATTLYD